MRRTFALLLTAALAGAMPASNAAAQAAPNAGRAQQGAAMAGLPSAGPAVPDLLVLRNFRVGTWVRSHQNGEAHRIPLSDGSMMLTGRRLRDRCNFVTVSDTPEEAIVTFRCPNGLSGRTELRRETASFYVVRAQGVVDNRPFAHRVEWRLAKAAGAHPSNK